MRGSTVGAVAVAAVAIVWAGGLLFPTEPEPSDLDVRALGGRFCGAVDRAAGLALSTKGALRRDRDTFFWKMFVDKFGSNPNTPYMWNALPLMGVGLPSPMWNLGSEDAVVMLSRLPPDVEYFSFTSFALFMPGRGLPFASIGDSVNSANIRHTADGLFAHVVTSNRRTAALVEQALVASGLPPEAINLVAVPADKGLFNDVFYLGGQVRLGTYFETVLRIFRWKNQTAGDAYLRSHPPVFYLRGSHGDTTALPAPSYKSRAHPDSVREAALAPDFAAHGSAVLAKVGNALGRDLAAVPAVPFGPLMIQGLHCLDTEADECLGDCPDAAYFGPHIDADSDRVKMLSLRRDDELHLFTLVNHRTLNASVYGSVAMLTPGGKADQASGSVSKTRMNIRATSLGVTSFDFPGETAGSADARFVSWAFTRNPKHCHRLAETKAVDGCSVVLDEHVPRDKYLTYCERIYLNPATGTGPDWADIVPARIHHIDLATAASAPTPPTASEQLFARIRFPPAVAVPTYPGEPLRFLHIVKTGGESLQGYLDRSTSPMYDFSTCRVSAAMSREPPVGAAGVQLPPNGNASASCMTAAAAVSAALCGLNCECCGDDIRLAGGGGFHGTLLRSPRAHALSLFSHGHIAHHTSWSRLLSDVPLYLAEGILRVTENACGSYCVGASPDWRFALEARLAGEDPPVKLEAARPLRVLPLDNTQSHALTCSKKRGSVGHHFRVLGDGSDELRPNLDATLAALRRFEWVGITDLMEPSLCLLHYQANGSLPAVCDCDSDARRAATHPLGHWKETRSHRRSPDDLAPETLERIDSHTTVDAALFAVALRLLLSRLRGVEVATGSAVLRCIDWAKLRRNTEYVPGLWNDGAPGSLV